MVKLLCILCGCLGMALPQKTLDLPSENIQEIALLLSDQLTGITLETYVLDESKLAGFIHELSASVASTSLKMNIVCYRYRITYTHGETILLATNGKGIGPTPSGYYLSANNLIFKYFPITSANYCKPKNGGSKGAF